MPFIENDDVVEQVAANRADQPLCERVLPGRARRGGKVVDAQGLDRCTELGIVDAVAVAVQEARRSVPREGCEQLKTGPLAGGVFGDGEVENAPAIVAEYYEATDAPRSQPVRIATLPAGIGLRHPFVLGSARVYGIAAYLGEPVLVGG